MLSARTTSVRASKAESSILKELLGKESWQHFSEYYLNKRPYAAPFNASIFIGLISWPILTEIFHAHNDCWLPRYGNLNAGSGKLNQDQALRYFACGHTVLVRHAEEAHPIFKSIADNFKSVFGRAIDIQIYVTPQGEEGFDWHYDVEDVFIIQSQGEKEFTLLPNTVTPRPLPIMRKENFFAQEIRRPEIKCLLKAGDWLYIPAGYWHKATAVTDSFHLSVGVL